MVEVFRGKDIKPDMDCIQTSSTLDCMKLLSTGDADLTMLDAGDVYRAGRYVIIGMVLWVLIYV